MQPGVAVEIADFIITIITCPLPDVFPLVITDIEQVLREKNSFILC
jgi:hypothetical protein